MATKKFNGKSFTLFKRGIALKANANVFTKGLKAEKRLFIRMVKESDGCAIYT